MGWKNVTLILYLSILIIKILKKGFRYIRDWVCYPSGSRATKHEAYLISTVVIIIKKLDIYAIGFVKPPGLQGGK